MIQITATDLKAKLGKYLSLVRHEEICITKNGRVIAVLSLPKDTHSWVNEVTGIIPNAAIDAKKIKAKRLTQKYESLD